VKSLRNVAVAVLFGALALLLVAAGPAGATTTKPVKVIHPPAKIRVGNVTLGRTPAGAAALLIPIHYPIEAANRVMKAVVWITLPGEGKVVAPISHRVSSGAPRSPERRRTFTFVHQIRLGPAIERRLEDAWREGRKPHVTVLASGHIDVDHDGHPELESTAASRQLLPPLRSLTAAGSGGGNAKGPRGPLCASVPVVKVAPRALATVRLPACTQKVHWSIAAPPEAGRARVNGEQLLFTAPGQPGTETVGLSHDTVVVKVERPPKIAAPLGSEAPLGPVVRAMGDSVTAGFGYYSDGSLMPFLSLYECKPVGTVLDDACSSNSTATKNGLPEVPYAADYGLANNVSWAAQWANEYGVTNYKNYAVSGSEPTNWAPGGSLYATTKKIEAENPEYILMTIGANPILANTLFGLGPARCALEADLFGGYEECVEEAFESVHLRAELKRLYTDLVAKTNATIYLMQYHLSVPSSAIAYSVTQIAEMAKMMNETIAEVAKEVSPTRLQVVTPPHFNVGVSLEPVYPASYSCSSFGFTVDGPSVQATPTQDELEAAHYLSFCEGPKPGGEPWVISGDTGIHPSAAGYAQMASQVPPPRG
jgi:lysophospholipase L1-like esterase